MDKVDKSKEYQKSGNPHWKGGRTERFSLQLPPWLKEKLRLVAKEEDISMNDFVVGILIENLLDY